MKTLSPEPPGSSPLNHPRPAAGAGVEWVPVRHQAWWLRGLYAISFESRSAKFCLCAFIVVVALVATMLASGTHNPHWNSLPPAPAHPH